jgi:hypothetical protein
LAKQTDDFRRYAVIGAEQRLLELAEEAAVIFTAFPELRDRGFMDPSEDDKPARGGGAGSGAAGQPSGRRKRRKMSAAARQRISDAQKARWAKQKAAAGKKR